MSAAAAEWRMLPAAWTITKAGNPPAPLAAAATVDDVEALCRGVIRELIGARTPTGHRDRDTGRGDGGHIRLEQCDYEETMLALFEAAVVLTRKYDRARAGIVFRPWLYVGLRRAAIDHWRKFHGRAGEKRVFDTRAAEQTLRDSADGDDVDLSVVGPRRPDGFASEGSPHAEADRALPREWVELPADRGGARPVGGLGVSEGGGDAGGARGAGPVALVGAAAGSAGPVGADDLEGLAA